MTEEQKKLKAERDRRYREKKKLEKAEKADLQAPVDPAPETAFQVTEEQMERYRQELQQQPVFVRQVPPPIVVEGNPDDLPPVEIPAETLTYFDVYKRRHEDMFR